MSNLPPCLTTSIVAASPSRASRSGNSRCPLASVVAGWRCTTTTAVPASATAVTTPSATTVIGRISTRSAGARFGQVRDPAGMTPTAQPHDADDDGDDGDRQRDQADVDETHDRLQPVDVAAQRALHLAQRAARLHELSAELLDLARLLRRQDRLTARLLAVAAQVGELLLGLLDLVLKLLLLRLEAALGILLDGAHQGEGPVRDAARAQAD